MGIAHPNFFLGPSEAGQTLYGTFTFPLDDIGGSLVRMPIRDRPRRPVRGRPLYGRTAAAISDTTPGVSTQISFDILKTDSVREGDLHKLAGDLTDAIGWSEQHLYFTDDDQEVVFENNDIEPPDTVETVAITGRNGHQPTDTGGAVDHYFFWEGGATGQDEVVTPTLGFGDLQMVGVDILGTGHEAQQKIFRVFKIYPDAVFKGATAEPTPRGQGVVRLDFEVPGVGVATGALPPV